MRVMANNLASDLISFFDNVKEFIMGIAGLAHIFSLVVFLI